MPKGDDGVMDNLDSRVERVEGFSRKERKDFLPRWERMISWREELELGVKSLEWVSGGVGK